MKGEQREQKERNATFGAEGVCSRARESCNLHSCNGDAPFKNKGISIGDQGNEAFLKATFSM